MNKHMKKLFCVKQAIWGGGDAYLFFENKTEANDYYKSHDYCDKPQMTNIPEGKAQEFINGTKYFINECAETYRR